MTASLSSDIESVLPMARQRPPAGYPIDGVTPRVAFRPETRDEVAALLQAADATGFTVAPQGSRTTLRLGRPLAAYDVALDLTGLCRVVAYEPEDLTVTVEAGMTLAALQRLLGERGQYLPVDPAPDDRVTVGGLLATARAGAWRGHLPAARDLVLGATVAMPDGALVRSGGRVVKNVSGYDLHRMHTGALGAFGVIVEASFKVAPLPAGRRSFALRCTNLEQASELAFALWDEALPLSALALLSPGAAGMAELPPDPYVLLEAVGNDAIMKRVADAVKVRAVLAHASGGIETDSQPWARLRMAAGGNDSVVLRLGVPASQVSAAIEEAEGAGCTAWGYLAAGAVLACAPTLPSEEVVRLRSYASSLGGFLQVESADASLRADVDPCVEGDALLVRALKAQFDPRGTINRGRWMEAL
ncbi:MAG: FAD-binding oxidoreductase [Dehalococcoidia bacterium]